jgi:hypothetical protein
MDNTDCYCGGFFADDGNAMPVISVFDRWTRTTAND